MKYEVNFGRAPTPVAGKTSSKFRIAILADITGRASRGELETGDELAGRKPHKIDIDNLETVIERLGIAVELPVGAEGSVMKLEVGSVDDIHPDELYDNLELFEELSSLRNQLSNSSTFAGAAAQVKEWMDDMPSTGKKRRDSGGGAIPVNAKLSDFAALVGGETRPDATEAAVEDLIRQAIAPHIVPETDPEQASMVEAVDASLSTAMRNVLHHPDFQTMESNILSLDFLVRRIETGDVELVLYDVSAEELAADLAAHDDLNESGIYKMLVENPVTDANQGAFSAIIGNFMFHQTPPHADLLGRMARVAASAQIPFISNIDKSIIRAKGEELHELTAEAWGALRALPESAYLCLVCPRFLLRLPYGKKTEPIDPFEFEEFTLLTGLRSMVWGNGAILAACLLGQNASRNGNKIAPNTLLQQGEMAYFTFANSEGDTVALPCAERLLSESLMRQVKDQGGCPLLAIKGRDEVRLAGFISVAGGDLAGPWGAAPSIEAAVPREEAVAADDDDDGDETSSDDDDDLDLDAMLSGLDDDDDDSSSDDDGDDDLDLDALLAGMDDDDDDSSSDDDDDDDDEMDADLAALLADL